MSRRRVMMMLIKGGVPVETPLLDEYGGASAAYSLRNLSSTTTSVVRVRRSSDNTEQDFSETQITDGTLTTFTGSGDGLVAIWYDQSGNGNNMTQVSALSQPNLVTNGSIVLSNNKPTLLFDQSFLNQSVNLNSSEAEHFLVIEASLYPPTSQQQTGLYQYNPSTSVNSHYSWTNGEIYDGFATSSRKTFTPPETLAKLNLYNVLSKSSEWSARLNSNEIFTTSNNTVNFGSSQRLGSNYSSSYHLNGYISEFMVYPSDQSTNRNGIETNINNEYAIYPTSGLLKDYPGASAAYSLRNLIDTTTNVVRVRRSIDNTEQDFSATQITDGTLTTFTGANDGFVTTWYDQSGNFGANNQDVTQTTASRQPKIVVNGVLQTKNSKPTLIFNKANSSSLLGNEILRLNSPNDFCSFGVGALNDNNVPGILFSNTSNNFRRIGSVLSSTVNMILGASTIVSNNIALEDNLNLITSYRSGNIMNGKTNGTELNSVTADNNYGNDRLSIGIQFSNNSAIDGCISEIIIYPTDQSSNITGIETNINNEYTIY